MLTTLSKIWDQLDRKEKNGLLALVGSRILIHGLDLAALGALAVLSAALANGEREIRVAVLDTSLSLAEPEAVFTAFLSILFLFLLKSGLGAFLLHRTTQFLAKIDARQARRVADNLFSGDLQELNTFSKGEVNWRVLRSSQSAFGSILFSATSLITEAALFAIVLALLLVVSPVVTGFLGLYFGIVTLVFTRAIGEKTRLLGARFQENATHGQSLLDSMVSTYRELIVSGRTPNLLNRLFEYRTQQARDWGLQRFYLAVPRFVVELALIGGIFSVVAVQVFVLGSTSFIDLGIFLLGGLRLMAALLPIQNAITELKVYAPQAYGALLTLDQAGKPGAAPLNAEVTLPTAVQDAHPGEGIDVRVRNLRFAYHGDSTQAIDNLSLSFTPNRVHAIVGPSGAGKSTLVDCITGLLRPLSGMVTLDGLPARELVRNYPGAVQYVPQKPGFLPGSIASNISLEMGGRAEDDQRMEEAVRGANLTDVVRRLKNGLDADLGNNLDSLSGGQLQRIALARALFHRPRLLLLDEFTSALDGRNEEQLSQSIRALLARTTVIVVTHRLSTLVRADEIHLIEAGRLSASGSWEGLQSTSQEFRAFLSTASHPRHSGDFE